ncbi:MAG: jacalin-like lectin [Enhygromyxa sp.]
MSEIDNVVAQIGNYFYHLSGENYVRIMDTPRIWGLPFGSEIMGQARGRQVEFQRAIEEVVQKAKYRCDVASLNAPDVDWLRVIIGAMDTCLSAKMGRTQTVQFRFLFGQTPMVPIGEPANYTELKAALVRLVRDRSKHWEQMPEIWLGRFYRLEAGIISAIQAKVFGSAVIGSDDTKMTWNHSKAIVVDGYEALAGGHNLNMDLFRSYPPVHDVSAVMHGDGAYGTQLFLNQMWQCGTDLLTKEYLELPGLQWKNADKDASKPVDPLASAAVQSAMTQAQSALVAMHESGKQSGEDPVVPPIPPPADGIRQNDLQTLQEVREDAFPFRVRWQLYQGFDEYKQSSRVLSLGKYWTGPNADDYQKASEIMKETLIKGAKKSIKMSQMDLVSAWKKYWKDHVVCQWVLEALLANPDLKVQIVVSPLDAGAGAEGDQYSFGSGAVRTYALMEYYMTHEVATDAPIPDPDGTRKAALKRLEIAPLYYTDKVPSDAMVEGETYKWPNLSPEGYTATLKQPPLSEKPPKEGVIGSAARSVLNASGYIYDKVPSAPGNHAKIMIVDDEAYVLGSDNLYPGFLSEFDYLVEGEQAVQELLNHYWTPLWTYSKPHRINASDDGGYTRTLPEVGGPGTAWSDTPPAGARLTQLTVHSGEVIDSLQATYGDTAMPSHGGPAGGPTVIVLADDEYITEISGNYGTYYGAVHICELTIRTNKQTHDTLGSTNSVHGVTPFVFKAESGEAIVSFSGRSMRHTDGTEFLSALGVTIQGG